MSDGYVQRTADQVFEMPTRALDQNRGAGLNKAIGTAAPTARSDAMGRTPQSCVLSFRVSSITGGGPTNITLYLLDEGVSPPVWFKGGANSNFYLKSFEEGCGDAFAVPPGALYCLVGAAEIGVCRICDTPFR